MRVEFYLDPETGEPHLWKHGVTEDEAEEILIAKKMDYHVGDGRWSTVGQTQAGRYLQVISTKIQDAEGTVRFVLTAYSPTRESIQAYRRMLKKKGKR